MVAVCWKALRPYLAKMPVGLPAYEVLLVDGRNK